MKLNQLSSSARKIFSIAEDRMLHNVNEMEKNFLSLCYYRAAHEPRALEILTELLDSGVHVDVKAAYDVTALNLICLTNTEPNAVDILRFLLERGANPNNRCQNGATPLHMLIWVNRTDTLYPLASLLIKYGADVNARQENNENSLHKLLRFNQTPNLLKIVQLLVESGVNINERGGRAKGFGSPLHILCETNQTASLYDVICYLVGKGASVNERDDKNNTVLHVVCRFNQTADLLKLVRYFVQKGADINCKNDPGQTAFHILCQYNQSKYLADVARFFIECGFEFTNDQTSVLSILCKHNQTSRLISVMKLLVESKADPNHIDHQGFHAIHYCAQYQKLHLKQTVKLLKDWGADLESLNDNQESFLHLVCQHAGHLNLFRFISSLPKKLIARLVNIPDAIGRTPLHHVVRSGCLKTANYLAAFAEYRIIDAFGKCVTDYFEDFLLNDGTAICLCCNNKKHHNLVELKMPFRKILIKETRFTHFRPQSISVMETSIPKQIDRVYVYNKCEKHVRIPTTQHSEKLVAWIKDERPDVRGLLRIASESIGCQQSCLHGSCSQCNMLLSIHSYMRCLVNEVEHLDYRFSTQLIVFYGSSAEQTKLFQLDEFDFLIVLSKFVEDKSDSNNIIFFGNEEDATFLTYDDGRKGISSGRAIYYFYQLLRTATKRVDHPCFHVRDLTFGETCATIFLSYSGCREVIELSIDITIGVARTAESKSMLIRRRLPSWCQVAPQHSQDPEEVLVPLRDKCGAPEWRVSFPSLERDSLLASGKEIRTCYRLLKLLVMISQPRPYGTDFYLVPQKTKPSSYALKTCLLRYMEYNPPPWRVEDTISHCISILEVYITNTGVHLMSFFDENLPVAYIDQEGISVSLAICNRLRTCLC